MSSNQNRPDSWTYLGVMYNMEVFKSWIRLRPNSKKKKSKLEIELSPLCPNDSFFHFKNYKNIQILIQNYLNYL